MKGEAEAMFRAIDERQQKKRARNVTIKRVIITLLLLAWLVLFFML